MPSITSLKWGRIVGSALLAAVIAMAIIYVCLLIIMHDPGGLFERICRPDTIPMPNTGCLITNILLYIPLVFFVCLFRLSLYALFTYLPLAVLISVFLINRYVEQRRLIHTILTVILSLPVAIGLLWLVGRF